VIVQDCEPKMSNYIVAKWLKHLYDIDIGPSILNQLENHPSQYYYDQSGFNFRIFMELECEKVIFKTHCLIEGFPLMTKAKQGFMVWKSYSIITSKINK
jgi:hypothetical protein